MPIGVADIDLVTKQVLEALHAAPRTSRYTVAIGEDSEYSVLQEVKDFVLMADEEIVLDILKTPGHGWRHHFMTESSALASGDFVPNHVGVLGNVTVSTGGAYSRSQQAESHDELLAMIRHPGLYASKEYHWIEDGIVLTPASSFKIWYPTFTRAATCQSPQTAEPALKFGAIELAEKIDGESQFFSKYSQLFQVSRQFVVSERPIPPQAELERMLTGNP